MDPQQLDKRWESLSAAAGVDEAISQICHLMKEASNVDRAYLLLARAGLNQSRQPSMELADDLNEALMLTSETGMPAYVAAKFFLISATRLMNMGDYEEADPLFDRALKIFTDLALKWQVSGALINRAINSLQMSQGKRALEFLATSISLVDESDRPELLKRQRQIRILINMAGAHQRMGQLEKSIELLLKASQIAHPIEDASVLGIIWLNLALDYSREHRYGSSLEAATEALSYLEPLGSVEDARRAEVCQIEARRQIGLVESDLTQIRSLVGKWEDQGQKPPIWYLEAVEELANTYRWIGDQRGALQADLELAELSSRASGRAPEIALLDRMHALMQVLLTGDLQASDKATASEELRRTASVMQESSTKWAPVVADVFIGMFAAFQSGEVAQGLRQRIAEAQEFDVFPAELGHWFTQTADAMATLGRGEASTLFASELIDLYRRQVEARSLEDESYRASYLAANSELAAALSKASKRSDGSAVLELIEFARTDLAAATANSSAHLPAFREVRTASATTKLPFVSFLGDPAILSLKGFSHIGAAIAKEPSIDLDALRRAWGGQGSVWLSLSLTGNSIFWSFLTSSGCMAGSVSIDEKFHKAMSQHRQMLVPPTADEVLLTSRFPSWVQELFGMARSAGGGLIDNQRLLDECLQALPRDLRGKAQEKAKHVAATPLDSTYAVLAGYIIPDVVREYLRSHRDISFAISPAPELASIPFALLPLYEGDLLIQHVAVQLMPPAGVAALSLTAANRPGPHLLGVENATGDLSQSTSNPRTRARTFLTGWSGAVTHSQLATRENLTASLNEMGTDGLFSFKGHIRPGVRESPGSSGLVLAPVNPWGTPDVLLARELISGGARFPSRVYLGGCEGTGFGTGLEWASVASVALSRGSACVLAHAWPIIDDPAARTVDAACIDMLVASDDPVGELRKLQLEKLTRWRSGDPLASPHWWAGIQAIGRRSPDATRT